MNEPAFPVHQITNGGFVPVGGMTLRDYFAAKALQPLIDEMISRKANIEGFDEAACVEAVRLSFITADAMLKSRTEPKL